jgi:hypothetical protein
MIVPRPCDCLQCDKCKRYDSSGLLGRAYRASWAARLAGRFGVAAVKHVMSGMPTVSPEEQHRRIQLCIRCPEFQARSTSCGKCGCFAKTKTSWGLEKCPLSHW